MESKKVSIVVPVYNGESFIGACLDQITNQTYTNLQIIVVNDGSTDNSKEIIQQKMKSDDRIFYYEKQNGGTGSALNLGFSFSDGLYETWSSCDDVKNENYIEQLVKCLEENPQCDFVFSDWEECYINKPSHKIRRRLAGMKNSGVMDNFLKVTYKHCITGICFMYTRKVREAVGKFEEIPGEDYIMGAKMGLCSKVYYLDKCLGTHILHPDCLTVKEPGCTTKADQIVRTMLKGFV